MYIFSFQEKRIQFEQKYDKLKGKGNELRHGFVNKGKELIHKWEENSRELIGNFLDLFGRDGRIVSFFLFLYVIFHHSS